VSVLDTDGAGADHLTARSAVIYRVDALHWIEDRGIPVLNSPRAIERTVDKFYTSALLREAGLPTPETVVCERASDALAAVAQFGDAVIKPIFGSMGHGMVRVTDVEWPGA
jgi:glutathione synthase/RimK-type ligase-like ATP-grasp enzyme